MAKEIERKFRILAFDPKVLRGAKATEIRQGYFSFKPEIRVRLKGEKGYLTIKSEGSLVRDEFEYEIPTKDAEALLTTCSAQIEKVRYELGRFEIDIFSGKLTGLVLAEVELRDESEQVELLVGFELVEVTADKRFKNKNLAQLQSLVELK